MTVFDQLDLARRTNATTIPMPDAAERQRAMKEAERARAKAALAAAPNPRLGLWETAEGWARRRYHLARALVRLHQARLYRPSDRDIAVAGLCVGALALFLILCLIGRAL